MRGASEWLRDVLEAISQIERHSARGRAAFEQDELIQVWVVHHLQLIGEAASRLDPEFRKLHPEAPWPQIIAMRNVLVHEYFGIDLVEVWRTIERDLPEFKRVVGMLLYSLEQQN